LVGAAAVVRVAGARRGHQPRARNRDDRLFHDEILRPVSPRKTKRWTSVAVPWRPPPAGREHRSEAERSGGMNDVTATVEPVPTDPPAEDSCELTSHVRLERVIMLINPLSGGVGPGAAEEALDILSRYACSTEVVSLDAGAFDSQIRAALDARPDALFVLAGDGTAGTIASLAGPDGPLVAPLPGGTMNMLPKALYGSSDWKTALKVSLEQGAPHDVAGGEVDDGATRQAFFCAAVFGAPALWAPAREAIRLRRLRLAWLYARRALRRAFSSSAERR